MLNPNNDSSRELLSVVLVCGGGAYIIQVEPVSTDGVQDPQQQVDLQGGVFEGYGLWRLRSEVCL